MFSNMFRINNININCKYFRHPRRCTIRYRVFKLWMAKCPLVNDLSKACAAQEKYPKPPPPPPPPPKRILRESIGILVETKESKLATKEWRQKCEDYTKCDFEHCDNPATLRDPMENKICEECMDREVDEGTYKYEDFETICG